MKTAPFKLEGSKVRNRSKIISFLDVPHRLYVEPFGGTGSVFFGKEPSFSEVYNDLNGLMVNFFKVLKDPAKRAQLQELGKYTPKGRQFWNEHKEICVTTGEERARAIEKTGAGSYDPRAVLAFAFFYCQNLGFGGRLLSSYGITRTRDGGAHARHFLLKLNDLDAFAERFALVQIENKPWKECIESYDTPDTLFYLDPPYETPSAKHYMTGWTSQDTKDLVDACLRLKGRAVLTCYDCELYHPVRDAGWRRVQWTSVQSVSKTRQYVTETLYASPDSADLPQVE